MITGKATDQDVDFVKEILNYVPHWLVRWGSTVNFIAIAALLLTSWFVRYPDIIPSRIVVTSRIPPASIVAQASGTLVLLVKDKELVAKNTYIGFIENPGNPNDIFYTSKQVSDLKRTSFDSLKHSVILFNSDLVLGDLQNAFAQIFRYYSDCLIFQNTRYYQNKITGLMAQIEDHNRLRQELTDQKRFINEQLIIFEEKNKNDRALFDKKLISQVEMDVSTSELLSRKLNLVGAEANMINNSILIQGLENSIIDLRYQYESEREQLILNLNEAIRRFETEFRVWEQKYAFKATISGTVDLFRFWSSNQYIVQGEEVMVIVPEEKSLVGKALVPQIGAGKVSRGQTVRIKFDDYPFNEFGVVEGEVADISFVSRDNQYSIEVLLSDNLVTSYGVTINFKGEMHGLAEVITKDQRFIERLSYPLRYAWDRSIH